MLINRVGTFLIFLGLGMIGLFILSDMAKAPACNLLIFGGISLAVGVFFWLRNPPQPGPPPDRFRILKGKKKAK